MLIISPPGGGKTTLLRSLARYIGSYKDNGLRTVIIDERCEIDRDDYRESKVDVLSGYKRHDGIEIAVRTMSPEVIMCDEIFSGDDSDALTGALGAGITVFATAHGGSLSDVMKRDCIRRLVELGAFSTLVTVTRDGGEFGYKTERLA